MSLQTALKRAPAPAPGMFQDEDDPSAVAPLDREDEAEVLDFLAERPVATVIMSGFIRDNGIESPLNRGTFYGCRNREGRLEGVALMGHATLIEVRTEAALASFARFARNCKLTHMILGEEETVRQFWSYYARDGREPRRVCREILFEQRCPVSALKPVPALRLATPDDLPVLLPVYASMVFEESHTNPLKTDPEGFRRRWLRRIDQDRVWVWIEEGRLIFNADIISDTPDCIYLEGIYVYPVDRGKGFGLRCMSQLSRNLLSRTESLCLLTNERNRGAHEFYEKVGYRPVACYDTIFLPPKTK